MKAGVATSPCGVRRRPQRAPPSRASRAKEKAAATVGLEDQHRVAVAVEAVAAGERVLVGLEHGAPAGEGRDQEEQRRAGQVEVGEERIDDPEARTGPEQELG